MRRSRIQQARKIDRQMWRPTVAEYEIRCFPSHATNTVIIYLSPINIYLAREKIFLTHRHIDKRIISVEYTHTDTDRKMGNFYIFKKENKKKRRKWWHQKQNHNTAVVKITIIISIKFYSKSASRSIAQTLNNNNNGRAPRRRSTKYHHTDGFGKRCSGIIANLHIKNTKKKTNKISTHG